ASRPRRSCGCRSCAPTCTTSTAWPRWRPTSSAASRERAGEGQVASPAVAHYLVATDADWILSQVRAALGRPDTRWTICRNGRAVREAVATAPEPVDVALLDLQIGTMGGMAVCLDLRLEESGGRLPRVPVVMLLDRGADVFLAQRSAAEGWL